MKTILSVEGLTVYRGSRLAIREVSFAVMAGTDTAIVGPNGAGKSTLVQAILGIIPRAAGEVKLLGQTLTQGGEVTPSVRQHIAYLPQQFQFDRGIPMTVAEFVGLGWGHTRPSFPWQHRQERRNAVETALDKVKGLTLLNHSLSGLSGGETKRVLLAYCLVAPRRLLILDEAPAGLDSHGEAEFYELLQELKTSLGWAILQISHNLDMVDRHCDRVICLNQSVVCQGSPELALSQHNLHQAYGPAFTRYRHNHD